MRKSRAEGFLRLLDEYLAGTADFEAALKHEATVQELSNILKVSPMTLCSYRAERALLEYRRQGNSCIYRLGHTREQLLRAIHAEEAPLPPEQEYAASLEKTAQVVQTINNITHDAPQTSMVHEPRLAHAAMAYLCEGVREKAMRAAKESYRDVILEAADQAEKQGDPVLANRLYKDFIHMEEALKVFYERK